MTGEAGAIWILPNPIHVAQALVLFDNRRQREETQVVPCQGPTLHNLWWV